MKTDVRTCMLSRAFILKMRYASDSSCTENQNTFYVQKLFSENHTVYEILWENIVEQVRTQMIIRCMRIACWIFKVITPF
jgi:hypothetical protein